MMRDRVLAWLANHVPTTLDHIFRVEQMAKALAVNHQTNVEKVGSNGIIHDLAKYFRPQKLLAVADVQGWEGDGVMRTHSHLLHADVSATVATDTFGINGDEEVLQAIANHTLGRPAMDNSSCIVFLADTLEPQHGICPEAPKFTLIQLSKYQSSCMAQLRLCSQVLAKTSLFTFSACDRYPKLVQKASNSQFASQLSPNLSI